MDRRSFLTGAIEASTLAVSGSIGPVAAAAADPATGAPPDPEAVLDPEWPIVDAHHHLRDNAASTGRPASRNSSTASRR